MRELKQKYTDHFKDRAFVISVLVALALLAGAIFVNFLSGVYATEHASQPVSDIVLSNIPVMNVDDLFVYGPIVFWVIISIFALSEPKRIPFWLKSVALFVVVRSVFITLTHIGPFPDHISIDSFSISSSINFFIFSSGADLFFSAHTGLPYLMALVFWDNKLMRIFCILSSMFFGAVVLLGHLHYSIDVMSAFFITYTIYHIARRILPHDLYRFEKART